MSSLFNEPEHCRHWAAASQPYASVDVLQDYLHIGWVPDTLATVETFFYGGYRRVDIYYITLRRGESSVVMPVLANPRLMRLIKENGILLYEINALHTV